MLYNYQGHLNNHIFEEKYVKPDTAKSQFGLFISFLSAIRNAWKGYQEASLKMSIETITRHQELFNQTDKKNWLRLDLLALASFWMMLSAAFIACSKMITWAVSGGTHSLLLMPFGGYFLGSLLLAAFCAALFLVFVRRYNPYAIGYRRDFEYLCRWL